MPDSPKDVPDSLMQHLRRNLGEFDEQSLYLNQLILVQARQPDEDLLQLLRKG